MTTYEEVSDERCFHLIFLVDHFYFDSFVPYAASISGGDYRSGSEALAFILTAGVASRTDATVAILA